MADSHAVLLGPLRDVASEAFHGKASYNAIISTWAILGFTLLNAGSLHLANVGMDVAIERDWKVCFLFSENCKADIMLLGLQPLLKGMAYCSQS